MGYTQSGLTQMINSLEKELGCKLLDRNYRGVSVSENGKALMPYIEQLLKCGRRLKEEAQHLLAGEQPSIRIGAFASMANNWLPPLIKEFRQSHPGISISIRVGGDEVPDWLSSGEIDLAFIDDSRKRTYKWLPVTEDRFVAVVPKDFNISGESITLQELVECPFIMTELTELKSQLEQLPEIHIKEGLSLTSADDATLLSMVEQGLGVTVLTEMCIRGHGYAVKAYPIKPEIKRTLGIALPKKVSPQTTELINYIQTI